MEKEKIEKLPKWAREKIQILENSNKCLEEMLSQFDGREQTNTFIGNGLKLNPLPKNTQIVFKTGENQKNELRVYIRENGEIDINSVSMLGQKMAILPRASNSFYITFID